MSRRVVDPQFERQKRDLRRRIARSRQRIERRLYRLRGEGRRLTSWRTWVGRYPASAMVGAMGLGLALSAGLGHRRLAGWIGRRLLRRAGRRLEKILWRELAALWERSTPSGTDSAAPAGERDSGLCDNSGTAHASAPQHGDGEATVGADAGGSSSKGPQS